jgi:tRNA pseudouridine13 synthase
VHRAISQHYGKVLESKTHESGSGGSRICVRLKRRRQDKRKRAPEAEAYAATAPRDAGPNHTIFVLQKRDVEHTRALELLSETLDCPVHTFGVCGIKDKVGVTTQLVSVRATTDITAALRQLQQPVDGAQPLVVGAALRQTNRALRRGQHYGNSFDLTLGGVLDTAIDRADHALQSVLDRGFVNYFGVQRYVS